MRLYKRAPPDKCKKCDSEVTFIKNYSINGLCLNVYYCPSCGKYISNDKVTSFF